MGVPKVLRAADLFVELDKAYRRHARRCRRCGFSLPYPTFRDDNQSVGAWSVIPSDDCSHECRAILEDLVSSFQKTYSLVDTGGFRIR
jgi:hypothetical protein